jgi:hypothetical protein
MGPKFDKIELLANGDLLVEGPFETHGEVIDDVVVRFLIIGEQQTDPIFGTATLAKSALTKSGTAPNVASCGRFSAIVTDSRLTAGTKVRGIGLSVAVKRADDPDPPAFETFTWCVNKEVTTVQAAT